MENETVKAIKAELEKAKELRTKAQIMYEGKKGIAQCETTGIEIPCIEHGGVLYSKFGDPLPNNWIWRPALSRKATYLLIGMLALAIAVIAIMSGGEW